MSLFGRRKPLHRRLAEAGGVPFGFDEPAGPPSASADPPGWDGEARGEPGIHGVPRARRWDAVVQAAAPGLRGDAVHFVALADGTFLVEEDEPEEGVRALADALGTAVAPPYRAEGVRQRGESWGVAASRIAVARVPGLTGDEAELVSSRDGRTLHVDGRPRFGSVPALERLGEAEGREYVVRASRLEGDLWEVQATAL